MELLMHGRPYFARLFAQLGEMQAGDWVHFADWRGDPDQELIDGEEFADVLVGLVKRGVKVRGMVWRSHPKVAGFHLEHHLELSQQVNDAGGLVLLDQRVRPAGSHHQKLVLLRHATHTEQDLAFVGGIDLCHGRRDDARHLGDPQVEELDEQYGPRPPWHDIQIAVSGPAVGDLDLSFRERWDDPTPLADRRTPWRALISRLAKQPERRDRLPEQGDDPEPAGSHAIQVLRTYPVKRPPYPFARQGERSVVRAYRYSFSRARCVIYVEDQYLWSREVARLFADALRRQPELRVMVVVPRVPDRNGPISGPPHRVAQLEVVARLRAAGGDRFAIYDLENEDGVPIYVHAKTVVIDDVWAAVGSDNLNRRSWTHDSELSVAVLDAERDTRSPADPGGLGDGARSFARQLRTTLLAEHLDVGQRSVGRSREGVRYGSVGCARAGSMACGWPAGTETERPPARSPLARRDVVAEGVGRAAVSAARRPRRPEPQDEAQRILLTALGNLREGVSGTTRPEGANHGSLQHDRQLRRRIPRRSSPPHAGQPGHGPASVRHATGERDHDLVAEDASLGRDALCGREDHGGRRHRRRDRDGPRLERRDRHHHRPGHRVTQTIAKDMDPASTPIDTSFSPNAASISPHDLVQEASFAMRDADVRRLPVVEEGRAVGIVSLGDLAAETEQGTVLASMTDAPPDH